MTHPRHQLAEIRTGFGGQMVASMPEVVEMHGVKAAPLHGTARARRH